jgi:phytoene dehydrogenase-like protein
MADASYDAVIVGGGQHGLILGCYLQNAGMSTVIFERHHELGGGICGEEIPIPGFVANPCAHWTRFYGHPAYADFNLREYGLQYIFPEGGCGALFHDGTCIVGYTCNKVVDPHTGRTEFSPEAADKTCAEIAKFSERDAETARFIIDKWQQKWRHAYAEYHWNPPPPWGVKNPIEKLMEDPESGVDPVYQLMPIYHAAYDLWESDEMRTWFMRSCLGTTGMLPHDVVGMDHYMLVLSLMLSISPTAIAHGGTHAIAHALQRVFSSMGGKFFVHHEVDKILIENGEAKGIRLVDGTEIEARKLVASDVDVAQTFIRLVGEEHVSPKIAHRAKNIWYSRTAGLWSNVTMHEPPEYKAADSNPDCQYLPRTWLVYKDPEYMLRRWEAEMYLYGYPSIIYMNTAVDSLWDKTRAPEGKHMALNETYGAPTHFLTEKEWLKVKKEYPDVIVRQWQWYAPNMTWDNVIAIDVQTPYDISKRNINMPEGSWAVGQMIASQMGRFRPFAEIAQYRTPIKNLYIGSANMHYGGGVGRSSSYNCFKVIAEDFGLGRIWEEKGRPY